MRNKMTSLFLALALLAGLLPAAAPAYAAETPAAAPAETSAATETPNTAALQEPTTPEKVTVTTGKATTGTGDPVTITTANVFPLSDGTATIHFEFSGLGSGTWICSINQSTRFKRIDSAKMDFDYVIYDQKAGPCSFVLTVFNEQKTIVYPEVTLSTALADVTASDLPQITESVYCEYVCSDIVFRLPTSVSADVANDQIELYDADQNICGRTAHLLGINSDQLVADTRYDKIFSDNTMQLPCREVKAKVCFYSQLPTGTYELRYITKSGGTYAAKDILTITDQPNIIATCTYDWSEFYSDDSSRGADVLLTGDDLSDLDPELYKGEEKAAGFVIDTYPQYSPDLYSAAIRIRAIGSFDDSAVYTLRFSSKSGKTFVGTTEIVLSKPEQAAKPAVAGVYFPSKVTGSEANLIIHTRGITDGTPCELCLNKDSHNGDSKLVSTIVSKPQNGIFDITFTSGGSALHFETGDYSLRIRTATAESDPYNFYSSGKTTTGDNATADTAIYGSAEIYDAAAVHLELTVPKNFADPVSDVSKLRLQIARFGNAESDSYPLSADCKTVKNNGSTVYAAQVPLQAKLESGNYDVSLFDGETRVFTNYYGDDRADPQSILSPDGEKANGDIELEDTAYRADGAAKTMKTVSGVTVEPAPVAGTDNVCVVLYDEINFYTKVTGLASKRIFFSGDGKTTHFAITDEMLDKAGVDPTRKYQVGVEENGELLTRLGRGVFLHTTSGTGGLCQVKADACEHGTLALDAASVSCGGIVNITAIPEPGYQLVSLKANGAAVQGRELRVTKDTTFTAAFAEVNRSTLSVGTAKGGTAVFVVDGKETASATLLAGTTVTLRVNADSGWDLRHLHYTLAGSKTYSYINYETAPDGTLRFTVPLADGTITPAFSELCTVTVTGSHSSGGTLGALPQKLCPGDHFTPDVKPDAGYYVRISNGTGTWVSNGVVYIQEAEGPAVDFAVDFVPLDEKVTAGLELRNSYQLNGETRQTAGYADGVYETAVVMNSFAENGKQSGDSAVFTLPVFAGFYGADGKLLATTQTTLTIGSGQDSVPLRVTVPTPLRTPGASYTLKLFFCGTSETLQPVSKQAETAFSIPVAGGGSGGGTSGGGSSS